MLVAVTGAGGFVGNSVSERLLLEGHSIRCFTRRPLPSGTVVPSIVDEAWWRRELVGVDVVVHCAARVHVVRENEADPLAAFRVVNVDGSAAIARAAAAVGVGQLVFLSTVGLHGRPGSAAETISESSKIDPRDAYAQSKLEAEAAIKAISSGSSLRYTFLRPPLVVGPRAGGNLALLATAVARGIPLPLGSIHNQRTLLSLPDLVESICRCLGNPLALDQEYLIGGDEILSTPEIVALIAAALGRPDRTFACPAWMLGVAAGLSGRRAAYEGLCGSLVIDSTKFRRSMNWAPSVSVRDALTNFATGYPKV